MAQSQAGGKTAANNTNRPGYELSYHTQGGDRMTVEENKVVSCRASEEFRNKALPLKWMNQENAVSWEIIVE